MTTSDLPLEIFGVYDRGIPNLERIVLRVNEPTLLFNYFLLLGVRARLGEDKALPLADNCLWLGDIAVDAPGWIFVYTGKGTPTVSQETHTGDPLQCMYWGKTNVTLSHFDIVPILIHIDKVQIGNQPNKALPNSLPPPPPPPPSPFPYSQEAALAALLAASQSPPAK